MWTNIVGSSSQCSYLSCSVPVGNQIMRSQLIRSEGSYSAAQSAERARAMELALGDLLEVGSMSGVSGSASAPVPAAVPAKKQKSVTTCKANSMNFTAINDSPTLGLTHQLRTAHRKPSLGLAPKPSMN